MNAYYIQDRLEAQSWARHYQQIAREEKEAELADDMEKGLPHTCLNRYASVICNATGPAKKPLPVRLMTMLSFRSAWQNTSGTWLKPLLTIRLILIQRYKTDEYSTRNAGREAG
ncbi:putative host-nuclease inhibitor protein Gam [Escherichia coli O145:H28 str. RM12761]|nr:putative host-nuclease inhibitor protein Gam [Escherichia coli O145:H28 str. RM13516]AHY63769.1 putative host-nuclease inhibitor protein Gam [Escherichia coli O145:H28 str. RM12761]